MPAECEWWISAPSLPDSSISPTSRTINQVNSWLEERFSIRWPDLCLGKKKWLYRKTPFTVACSGSTPGIHLFSFSLDRSLHGRNLSRRHFATTCENVRSTTSTLKKEEKKMEEEEEEIKKQPMSNWQLDSLYSLLHRNSTSEWILRIYSCARSQTLFLVSSSCRVWKVEKPQRHREKSVSAIPQSEKKELRVSERFSGGLSF